MTKHINNSKNFAGCSQVYRHSNCCWMATRPDIH